jgi:hypothetical protein
MKHIGVDYLYNWEDGKITKPLFSTNHQIEYYWGYSQKRNSFEVAISREFLYGKLKIHVTKNEYDVFDISSDIEYIFVDGDVQIKNEEFVRNLASEIAKAIYQIGKSIIGTTLLNIQNEKSKLYQMLKKDCLVEHNNAVLNNLFSLELLTESESYVIRDNKGNNLLKFKNKEFAQNGFKIFCDGIVRYIRCLLPR